MSKRNSGLGRGLDAIFLDNALTESTAAKENAITRIKLSLIDPNKDQPRKHFDRDSLEELAASIKDHGLLQPILVREYGEGRYQIIAGERRFRASKLAELDDIPAMIIDKDERSLAEISLIENIQRENLNPVEEALALRALAEEYGLTQEDLSLRVGKSRSAVANTVRLLDLPDEVLETVALGKISAGHARALLGLKNRDDILPMAKKVIELDLSVRRLEEEVKRANRPARKEKEETDDAPVYVDYLREMELRIQRTIGRRAKIEEGKRKKTLTLYYEDNEDLDELLRGLCGDDFFDEV